MSKVFNRDVELAGGARLMKNGHELVDKDGNIKADIKDTLASGKIYVGSSSNVSAEVAVSGDATLDNTGALTIANNAVTTAKILNANVTADKLASDSVTTAKILNANVTADKIASDAVTTTKILDANVTAAKLAAAVAGNGLTGGAGSALAVGAGTGIAVGADTVGLATGYTPSHVVKFAGTHAFAGGGAVTSEAVTGVVDTDIIMATIKNTTAGIPLLKTEATTDTITFTFGADPGADTQIYYTVFRAVA